MSTFIVNKNAKSKDGRTNTLQRKLTQQLLDDGLSRDLAIRHAEVTIYMSTESFDKHGKSIPQVFQNSWKLTMEDMKDTRMGPNIDVFNRHVNYTDSKLSSVSNTSV